jgi:hypothetical protein
MIARPRDKQLRIFGMTENSNGAYSIPAGHAIGDIFIRNTTANAVTGGLDIGTTLAGQEVVAAFAIGASAIDHLLDSEILLRWFSETAGTPLYFTAHSAWNSASLKIWIPLFKLVP